MIRSAFLTGGSIPAIVSVLAMASSAKRSEKPKRSRRAAPAKSPNGHSRNEILEAALKVFARHSFEGASLQEIADLASIGQPLVHYHFGSKENLWKAAVDYALTDLRNFYESIAVTTVDLEPVDVIRVLCRSFLNFSARCPEHALIMINEMRVPNERFDWLTEKYLRPIHHHLDTILEAAKRKGQIRDIPVVYLTNTIFISLVHFFTIAPLLKSVYETDAFDPETRAAHANHTMSIIFDGIAVHPERAGRA